MVAIYNITSQEVEQALSTLAKEGKIARLKSCLDCSGENHQIRQRIETALIEALGVCGERGWIINIGNLLKKGSLSGEMKKAGEAAFVRGIEQLTKRADEISPVLEENVLLSGGKSGLTDDLFLAAIAICKGHKIFDDSDVIRHGDGLTDDKKMAAAFERSENSAEGKKLAAGNHIETVLIEKIGELNAAGRIDAIAGFLLISSSVSDSALIKAIETCKEGGRTDAIVDFLGRPEISDEVRRAAHKGLDHRSMSPDCVVKLYISWTKIGGNMSTPFIKRPKAQAQPKERKKLGSS